MHALVLVLHIGAGTAGLLFGAAALCLPKRPGWNPRIMRAYVVAVTGTFTTAVGLAALHPAMWWLSLIAIATQAAALGGYLLARRRMPGWAGRSVRLLSMSYVSLVTALLVVSVPVPVVWVIPTLIGEPLIQRMARAARARETNATHIATSERRLVRRTEHRAAG